VKMCVCARAHPPPQQTRSKGRCSSQCHYGQ
jgi:hypothetical protein